MGPEPPRRDNRLTLELFGLIATATDGGQFVKSNELKTMAGRAPEQIRRELGLLRDEELIHFIDMSTFKDPGAMVVKSLTPAGWARLEELRQRHRRRAWWAVRQSWPVAERWIFGLGVPVALALLGWLVFAG